MSWLLALLGGVGTGGLSLLGTILPGLATAIGDIWLKSKQTAAAREGAQDVQGTALAGSFLQTVTEANRSRVEARKNEGAWGPLGIVTFLVGICIVWIVGAFAFHVSLIILDSTPWSLFGLFEPHIIGSWKVAPLPKPFDQIELAAINAIVSTISALFYTAPPAAAAVAVAKVFRR